MSKRSTLIISFILGLTIIISVFLLNKPKSEVSTVSKGNNQKNSVETVNESKPTLPRLPTAAETDALLKGK